MSTISQLLTEIEKGTLILPEFQRGYVWRPHQVLAYIRSLYLKYPTGHFLIWKTFKTPKVLRGDTIQHDAKSFKLLLDGQQRLTSLYTVFKGEPPPFYEGETLFFNLYFNIVNGDFGFWQPVKMKDNPIWIPVTEFLKKGINQHLTETATLPDELRNLYLTNLPRFNQLDNIRNYPYHLDTIPQDDQEMPIKDVVEIFNLVNSKGTPLSKADLALAHICSDWPEARQEFNKARKKMKAIGFDFNLDFFVRCVAGVAVNNILLEGSFYKTPTDDLKEAWKVTEQLLEYMLNVLRNDAYIDSSKNMTTPYVILTMVVYLAKKKTGYFESEAEKKRFLYWMYAAQMWGRYSGSTDSKLQADINVLNSDKPVDALIQNILSVSGRIKVEPKDLVQKGVYSTFYKMTYIVARSQGAVDWFTGLGLYGQNLGKPYKIESHHIFPQSLLYKSGQFNSSNQEHKRIVNEIANRAFLTKRANLKASNRYPENYLPKVLESYPQALKTQFVPENHQLWKLDQYESFLAERRNHIAEAINEFMDNLLEESKPDALDSNMRNLIENGESTTLEFKSSTRWDYKQNNVNKILEKVIVKTVSGFLNAEGGKLLIGVDDDGNILGLTRDYNSLGKKDRDGYELFLRQLISNAIGKEYSPFIYVTFHELDEEDICLVSVDPCHEPVFVRNGKDETFYVRMGNSTQQLNTSEAVNYISTHWAGK
jgi:hypothetical protein